MASTYSKYKLALIDTGTEAGQWGTITNANLGSSSAGVYQGIEQAIGGKATIDLSAGGTIALTLTDTNAAQNARALYLDLGGSPSGAVTLEVPAIQKSYIVKNGSGQQVTIKVSGQTGVVIPNGKTVVTYNNGTDVVTAIDYIPSLTLGAALPVASGGTGITSFGTGVATWLGTPSSSNLRAAVTDETGTGSLVFATSPTLTTPILGTPTSGTLTNCTGLPIVGGTTGTLSVARGGTGITSFGSGVATWLGTPSSTNLRSAVTDETGSGSLVFATSPTLVTPVLGTPTSGNLGNCTVDGTNKVGFLNIPQQIKNSAYTLVLGDSGKHIYKSNTTAYTWTIPANASVAFPIGTAITFINGGASGDITISITSDTMRLAVDGTTGSRTLAGYGVATAIKVASTTWIISGNGLT